MDRDSLDARLEHLYISAEEKVIKQGNTIILTMTFKNAKIIKTGADGCLRKGWTYEYSDTSYRGKKG